MPKVSIIIPAYNSEKYITGAIQSALSQSFADCEIIIVNDGSTDNTAKICYEYKRQYPHKINCISQQNTGVSSARNNGIKAARGEYIAFIDSDDELSSNAIEEYLKAIEANGAEWCVTDILRINGGKSAIKQTVLPGSDYLYGILKEDFIRRAFFFSKKTLFEIGLYDETLLTREDWDLNIRLIAANKPFAYIDSPLYIYKICNKSLIKSNTERALFSTLRLLMKHHKNIADKGNRVVAEIYSEQMWGIARRYFCELKDMRKTLYCIKESLKYNFNLSRVCHAVLYNIGLTRN